MSKHKQPAFKQISVANVVPGDLTPFDGPTNLRMVIAIVPVIDPARTVTYVITWYMLTLSHWHNRIYTQRYSSGTDFAVLRSNDDPGQT
jgi:hypothetical protein